MVLEASETRGPLDAKQSKKGFDGRSLFNLHMRNTEILKLISVNIDIVKKLVLYVPTNVLL